MSFTLPSHVKIIEVGPRDGLQNEATLIPLDTKVELIRQLNQAGIQHIEAGAFVSPKWVPQMANSLEVFQQISRQPKASYSALIPNLKGLEQALLAQVDEVVIFSTASERFAQKNINCSIQESFARFQVLVPEIKRHHLRLRGSISCAFECPYEGKISPSAVRTLVQQFRDLGCDEIDIADTIGTATPKEVHNVMHAASLEFPITQLAGHFHDTYGQGVSNVYAALETGITIFHSSIGSLGGCPYAPGASGNVGTEEIVFLLEGLGIATGIHLPSLVQTGRWISQQLNKPYQSRVGNALK
jgi:hydroxymethylglutaryl-CoA lyase